MQRFDELISYFKRKVSEMEIGTSYKMELLGMVTALGYAHEKETKERKTGRWIPCSEKLPGKEKTENDYIAEFIKERHPYMLDSFAFSAWKIKHSCYELGQTFKEAAQENKEAWDSAWNGVDELETDGYTVQQRGTVVTCGINKCKHNDDGLCKAESIYLSEDHSCDGGCDDGWVFDERSEQDE